MSQPDRGSTDDASANDPSHPARVEWTTFPEAEADRMTWPMASLLILLLAMSFVVTFALTWWIRGRGFGELLELFGRKPGGPRP
jgi:hypothetical protein